jgi:hypothetical protein
MLKHAARRWGDASDETLDIFQGPHLVTDISIAMKSSLSPGPHLDQVNARMGNRVLVDVDALLDTCRVSQNTSQIKLLEWTRHVVMQASSSGIYGSKHPFLDIKVENAFW